MSHGFGKFSGESGRPIAEQFEGPVDSLPGDPEGGGRVCDGFTLEPAAEDVAVHIGQAAEQGGDVIEQFGGVRRVGVAGGGRRQRLVADLGGGIAHPGKVPAGLAAGLAQGDPGEQAPELGGRVDPELAAGRPAEEGAEGRLGHVLGINAAGQSAVQPTLGEPGQPFGVQANDLGLGVRVAGQTPGGEVGSGVGIGHDATGG